MNRQDLTDRVAAATSPDVAPKAVAAVLAAITDALSRGDAVHLEGFGVVEPAPVDGSSGDRFAVVPSETSAATACKCPVCEAEFPAFLPFAGDPRKTPRPDALCPHCRSLERHRLIWLYLTERTNLLAPPRKRLLHVAPEPIFTAKLQQHTYIDYLSIDLDSAAAMLRMDLTGLEFPDQSFDAIYCSHVLEHIPNDRQAMAELHRVLRDDGWAILQVPILREETHEDASITDPEERSRLFGQFDHVRAYGPDYGDRLMEAGFRVYVDDYARRLDPAMTTRYGIDPGEDVYLCYR